MARQKALDLNIFQLLGQRIYQSYKKPLDYYTSSIVRLNDFLAI